MSAKEDLAAYLERMQRGVLRIVKTAMDEAPTMISAFTGEFLQDPGAKSGLRKSKKGNLYYDQPNETRKLRTQYGNLQRAITPDETGNVTNVYIEGSDILVDFGIDYGAEVKAGKHMTTLNYADPKIFNSARAIAQRQFLTLGFTRFMKDADGLKALMQQIDTDLLDLV